LSDQKNNIKTPFFITGMMRSGTSLLTQLLNHHPQVSCSNQELTHLFLEAKEAFNLSKGINDYHILNPLFKETRYEAPELLSHLESLKFKNSYLENLPKYSTAKNTSGNKEIMCEEFIEYFTQQQIKCILLIRDPRDIISSLHYGKHEKFTGSHRPVLFELRNWRKSIHHSILHKDNVYLLSIQYEDLVKFPDRILKIVTNFLNIDSFHKPNEIRVSSNSSYNLNEYLINDQSVGAYKNLLDAKVKAFIEQTCFPEMLQAGYLPSYQNNPSAITDFKDPFPVSRKEFVEFMKFETAHKYDEIKRLELLTKDDIKEEEIKLYFRDSKIYSTLAKQVR
jgi:hypothetical protein